MLFDATTTIIAIYGAILSTLNILWGWYKSFQDKGKLKVHCCIVRLLYHPLTGIKDNKQYVDYKITNTGKRPIFLANVGGRTKKSLFIMDPTIYKLPKQLVPGEKVSFHYPDLLEQIDENLLYLCAFDTISNEYKASSKDLKEMIRVKNLRQSSNSSNEK